MKKRQYFFISYLLFIPFLVFSQQTIFSTGEDGYKCFRIPAIVAKNKILFAFCEGRKSSCADFGDVDIVYKVSYNSGKDWTKLRVLVNNAHLQAGNPAPVFDLKDPNYPQGRLFVFYNTGTNTEAEVVKGSGIREVWFIATDNLGESWTTPMNITRSVHKPNEPNFNPEYQFVEDWRHYANTPGHALQLENGRIYVPINISIGDIENHKIPYRTSAFYSDDHAKTFHLSDILTLPGSNEATAAQLSNGEILLNARDQTENTGKRYFARSKDFGTTWYKQGIDTLLNDPVCQGSLITFKHRKNTLLVFSNLNHQTERKNLTLSISEDGGLTWVKKVIVDAGSSAYSDLVQISKKNVAILYEKDNYQKIDFKILSLFQ